MARCDSILLAYRRATSQGDPLRTVCRTQQNGADSSWGFCLLTRRTIYSFLLALLLAIGLRLYTLGRVDDCTPYFRGDNNAQASQLVYTGRVPREVPCTVWWTRQPQDILIACLLDGALVSVALVSALLDLAETYRSKRQKRAR